MKIFRKNARCNMKVNKTLNMTMLCDFYELTMGNGYFVSGMKDQICYFDVFYRNVPDNGGFAIAAGLEQVVEYIQDLHFSAEDIEYLLGRKLFDEAFCGIWRTSASRATSTPCRRARPSSRRSRS